MHELPVMNSVLNVVLKHARVNQAQKVVTIRLEVGSLSDLEDKWMQQYFNHLSKDSIAEGAKLVIERVPAVFSCDTCGERVKHNRKENMKFSCSQCGGEKFSYESGREYYIKDMEVL